MDVHTQLCAGFFSQLALPAVTENVIGDGSLQADSDLLE